MKWIDSMRATKRDGIYRDLKQIDLIETKDNYDKIIVLLLLLSRLADR